MIGEPPLEAGGVYDTVALPLPAVAVPMVGVPGTVAGGGVAMKWPKALGLAPTATVATTLLVAVSITEILLLRAFTT